MDQLLMYSILSFPFSSSSVLEPNLKGKTTFCFRFILLPSIKHAHLIYDLLVYTNIY